MKKKYSFLQAIYLLLIKSVILVISTCMLIPCINFVVDSICESEHKEAFFEAHYSSEPQIFFESVLGITDEKGA